MWEYSEAIDLNELLLFREYSEAIDLNELLYYKNVLVKSSVTYIT